MIATVLLAAQLLAPPALLTRPPAPLTARGYLMYSAQTSSSVRTLALLDFKSDRMSTLATCAATLPANLPRFEPVIIVYRKHKSRVDCYDVNFVCTKSSCRSNPLED